MIQIMRCRTGWVQKKIRRNKDTLSLTATTLTPTPSTFGCPANSSKVLSRVSNGIRPTINLESDVFSRKLKHFKISDL